MPTYDYQCDACGHLFEAFQSMKDDPLTVCPSCNQASLRRIITGGVGVIFKGSGFYVNDSRGSSTSSGTGGTGSDSSAATGTGAGTSSDGGNASKGSGDSASTSGTGGGSSTGETRGKKKEPSPSSKQSA